MTPPERYEDGRPPMYSKAVDRGTSDGTSNSRQSLPSSHSPPRSPPRGNLGTSPTNASLNLPDLGDPFASFQEREQPRPPAMTRKHSRNVSWDASNAPMSTVMKQDDDEDIVSYISNPDIRALNQSEQELAGEALLNPLESEAETYIQRTLDEIDPTKAGPSDAQQSILGFVPEEAGPETFEPTPKIAKPTLSRSTTKSRTHGRKQSTAEDLFQLANDLTMLNKQHGGSSDRGIAGLSSSAGSGGFLSDQDKLIKNAATLIQRSKDPSTDTIESSVDVNDPGNDISAKSGGSAKDRWKTLARTVQATSPSDPKKTDEGDRSRHQSAEVAEHLDIEANQEAEDDSSREGTVRSNGTRGRSHVGRSSAKQMIKSRYKDFEDWLKFRKMSVYAYVKFLLLWLILPAIGVAAILFYLAGNPPCGTRSQCRENFERDRNPVNETNSTGATDIAGITRQIFGQASASWWILFICCRQPITLSLSLATQSFIIEFLALRTKWAVKLVGPFITLFIVQSKGWPFIIFWWSVYNFVLLYGPSRWARHWLYWQDYVDLFNESNPSGRFTDAPEYRTFLILTLAVSAVVALKRFWVGLWFGKKTFQRYADDLTTLMKKALLIGLVAGLAKEKEEQGFELDDLGLDVQKYDAQDDSRADDASKDSHAVTQNASQGFGLADASRGSSFMLRKASMSSFQKIRIDKLLGAWEEPEVVSKRDTKAPIAAIIQFRQSLSYLNTAFPFSVAFGPASNRTECISSTEEVYKRLKGSSNILRFDLIASLAIQRNGELDEDTVKSLIKLFRPERDGSISLLHFAKSIDTVYKELRLLRASVANSTKMDASFEAIFNFIFYFIIVCIVLSVMGIDPIVIFASISGFLIGFAFMIGSACAKFFEGMLFILVRKPYDIGDRINVSDVSQDTDFGGAPGWIVKDVDLFTTTVVYASTNEVATYANSSLAGCRIINASRSPKAVVIFMIKFPLDTTYKKLKIFKGAVEEFIKARPREWRSLLAFRANRVEVDAGFVEYIVVCEHRESWQLAGDIFTSKANLTSFCLELSKKMNMRFRSPPMPVDLNVTGGASKLYGQPHLDTIEEQAKFSPQPYSYEENSSNGRARTNTVESVDWKAVSAMFDQKK